MTNSTSKLNVIFHFRPIVQGENTDDKSHFQFEVMRVFVSERSILFISLATLDVRKKLFQS
jgi:hypothetical protein